MPRVLNDITPIPGSTSNPNDLKGMGFALTQQAIYYTG